MVGWISNAVRLKSASRLRSACSVVWMFAAADESIHTGIFSRLPAASTTETAPSLRLGLRTTRRL